MIAAEQPAADSPRAPPFQFGLIWIMAVTAGTTIFLALWSWSPEIAVAVAGGTAILALSVRAVQCPDSRLELCVTALPLAILLVVVVPAGFACGHGDTTLPVTIVVRDRASKAAVAGATVSLKNGQRCETGQTNLQGRIDLKSEFRTVYFERLSLLSPEKRQRAIAGGHAIRIEAAGFTAFEQSILSLGVDAWDYRSRQLEIVVDLARDGEHDNTR